MEIKELGIGNAVLFDDKIDVVTDFYGDRVRLKNNRFDESVNKLSPIEISEEILLQKLNFNKDYKKGYIGIDYKSGDITTDFVLTEPGFMGEWQKYYAFAYDSGLSKFKTLRYVHELQNLFYILTSEELNLTTK